MSDDVDVRIGDTERNEARALLDIHLAEGRLTIAEHEERCALAGIARTRGELELIFDDLPAPHPDLGSVTRPVRRPDHPPSGALATSMYWIAVLCFLLGLPAAVVLTLMEGAWWMFLVVFGVMMTALAVGGATDKSQRAG